MMNKAAWYAKQYWKLFVEERELDNNIRYMVATDFCSVCDQDHCCKARPDYMSQYDDDFEALAKLRRLRDFAYTKGCAEIALMRPEGEGLARSIYDLKFPEVNDEPDS